MTLVCKSHGIGDSLINPIYGCSVKITPNINPIYVGIETLEQTIPMIPQTCMPDTYEEIYKLWL